MRPQEVIKFDAAAYKSKAGKFSDATLRAKESKKKRQALSATYGVTLSSFLTAKSFFFPPLLFVPLAIGAYSARVAHVAERKMEILREKMNARGQRPIEYTSRDYAAAVVPFAAGQLIGNGIGDGLEQETGLGEEKKSAAENATGEIVSHKVLDKMQQRGQSQYVITQRSAKPDRIDRLINRMRRVKERVEFELSAF